MPASTREGPAADRADRAGTAPGGRVVVVALCGGADRPCPELGGRTPFEAAPTPNLDALAGRGRSGLVEVIAEGIPPESDSGAMSLLGYDPREHYTGRGPLEGLGMDFWDPGGSSVAFRVNFASWDPRTGLLDRRTARDLTDGELEALVGEIREGVRLDGGVEAHLTGFGRHRGILAFTSRALSLSGRVGNTDPGFVNRGPFGVPVPAPSRAPLPCEPRAGDEAAARTAALVNDFVRRSAGVLEASEVNRARRARGRAPANVLLVRDAGDTLPALEPFVERTGRRLALYGQVPAERGLTMLAGGRFVRSRPGSAQPVAGYYEALVGELAAEGAGVVFVHVKGPDEPGHDGLPLAKAEAIADIDAHLIGPLVTALGVAATLVVTCDHATPCGLGLHAADRVPVTVAGPGVPADGVRAFGEGAAAGGALPVAHASDLLAWVLAGVPA